MPSTGLSVLSPGHFPAPGRTDTQDTQDTQRTPKAPKPEYYRFNLKMPLEYKDYLQAAAYRASSPTKTVTITEYICELVRADMERHKDQ